MSTSLKSDFSERSDRSNGPLAFCEGVSMGATPSKDAVSEYHEYQAPTRSHNHDVSNNQFCNGIKSNIIQTPNNNILANNLSNSSRSDNKLRPNSKPTSRSASPNAANSMKRRSNNDIIIRPSLPISLDSHIISQNHSVSKNNVSHRNNVSHTHTTTHRNKYSESQIREKSQHRAKSQSTTKDRNTSSRDPMKEHNSKSRERSVGRKKSGSWYDLFVYVFNGTRPKDIGDKGMSGNLSSSKSARANQKSISVESSKSKSPRLRASKVECYEGVAKMLSHNNNNNCNTNNNTHNNIMPRLSLSEEYVREKLLNHGYGKDQKTGENSISTVSSSPVSAFDGGFNYDQIDGYGLGKNNNNANNNNNNTNVINSSIFNPTPNVTEYYIGNQDVGLKFFSEGGNNDTCNSVINNETIANNNNNIVSQYCEHNAENNNNSNLPSEDYGIAHLQKAPMPSLAPSDTQQLSEKAKQLNLTPTELSRIKHTFTAVDTGNSGKISVKHMKKKKDPSLDIFPKDFTSFDLSRESEGHKTIASNNSNNIHNNNNNIGICSENNQYQYSENSYYDNNQNMNVSGSKYDASHQQQEFMSENNGDKFNTDINFIGSNNHQFSPPHRKLSNPSDEGELVKLDDFVDWWIDGQQGENFARMKQAFDSLDVSCTGEISRADFEKMSATLRLNYQTMDELKAEFEMLDFDKDGVISWDDFVRAWNVVSVRHSSPKGAKPGLDSIFGKVEEGEEEEIYLGDY